MAGNKNSGRRGLHHEKALAEKQRQWREAIHVSKILKRFQAYTLGEKENGKTIDLTPQQVTVGLGLLKKVLPDLQSGELHVTGNPLSDLYDTMTQNATPVRKTNGHAGNGHAHE